MVNQLLPNSNNIIPVTSPFSSSVISGVSPKFDFEKRDFVLDAGDLALISGSENLNQWIRKSIGTERYKYPIYTWNFGNEIFTLFGTSLISATTRSVVDKFIKDALLYDSRISEVLDVESKVSGDALIVQFKVVTSDDRTLKIAVDLLER